MEETFDIEYQTEDPETVVLWLRTPAAKAWADETERQRVGTALPLRPSKLAAVMESAEVYSLDVRELPKQP